ncbi:transposase [Mesorhizobium sp. M0254]
MGWCRANDVDFILGVAPTTTFRKHVMKLEANTLARFETSSKTNKVRRFKEFLDGAGSWSRVERIIARVEVGAQGSDTRFIVTDPAGGKAKALYAAGAYWMMWGLRAAMPKRSSFAVALFDTLRLRLIKIATRVVEMKTEIRLHLPTSYPDQRILCIVLDRIPRLAT